MNSTEPGKISGSFSQQELERLDEILRSSEAKHVLVAMHHQPVPVDAPWIDRYALENPSLFFNFIDRDRRVRCIVWGHVHQDFISQREGVMLLGAPSTVANSLPRTRRFTLDLAGPSFRWLELNSDGTVKTGIQLIRQGAVAARESGKR